MFDYIRKHTRVLFFALIVLIIPSFVFFGLEGYTGFRERGTKQVAEIAGITINEVEWDNAHREQIERRRKESPDLDAKALDTPELRNQTLDALIRERLMLVASDKLHLVTSDERMLRLFRADPQFAFLRNPDGSLNRDLLAAQGMSSELFAQRLRQDLSSRQVMQGVRGTVMAPAAAASAALDAYFQQREVQVQRFKPEAYASRVKPSDADLEAFYKDPANAAQFQSPEQVDVEYVVLDARGLAKNIKIGDDDLRKYYTENKSRYTAAEERRASHILITVDKSASAEVRAAAKAKAEALLAEVRKAPDSFADLARKNSQDPGSAQAGGDLDFFGRGAMVKPFEDAAFALKPGEIGDLVTSDFGYHVIRLTAVRGGEVRSFDSVRAEIEAQLTQQLAQQKYSELAPEFSNLVYEQSDSLQPAAERFGLQIQSAKGLRRNPGPGVTGPLASAKLLEAVFAGDATRNKRNTDAVETAPSVMVSARVIQYLPARMQPLEAVRDQLMRQVGSRQAAALARQEGEARLAALKADPGAVFSEPTLAVSRVNAHELPSKVIDAALRESATKLPGLFGVDLGIEGYAVVKLLKVDGMATAARAIPNLRVQYAQALADAEERAYFAALEKRYKVDRSGAAALAAKAASAAAN